MAVVAGLEVVVVEDLEAAVVGALEEEEVVEDVVSGVCSFFLDLRRCVLVLASE